MTTSERKIKMVDINEMITCKICSVSVFLKMFGYQICNDLQKYEIYIHNISPILGNLQICRQFEEEKIFENG